MAPDARRRAEQCLEGGCYCKSETATLTRRLIRAAVTVHLQCDQCGRSIGGAQSRQSHYAWQDYRAWDAVLPVEYSRRDAEERHARSVKEFPHLYLTDEEREERQQDYLEWCATSPEWAALREAVVQRAGRLCEACLTAPATTAHHLSYDLGLLPPGWLLKAVCARCHDRIHADKTGQRDEWCPASRRIGTDE